MMLEIIVLPLPLTMVDFHTIAEPGITDLFIERNIFI